MKTSFRLNSLLKPVAFSLCLLHVSQVFGLDDSATDRQRLLTGVSTNMSSPVSGSGGGSYAAPVLPMAGDGTAGAASGGSGAQGGAAARGGWAPRADAIGPGLSLPSLPAGNPAVPLASLFSPPPRNTADVRRQIVFSPGGGLEGDHVAVAVASSFPSGYGPVVAPLFEGVSDKEATKAYQTLIDYVYDISEGDFWEQFLESQEGASFKDIISSEEITDALIDFLDRYSSEARSVVDPKGEPQKYLRQLRSKAENLKGQLQTLLDSLAVTLKTGDAKDPALLLQIINQKLARLDVLEHKEELEVTKRSLAQENVNVEVTESGATKPKAARAKDSGSQSQAQARNGCINFIKTWGGWCVALGMGGVVAWLGATHKI